MLGLAENSEDIFSHYAAHLRQRELALYKIVHKTEVEKLKASKIKIFSLANKKAKHENKKNI